MKKSSSLRALFFRFTGLVACGVALRAAGGSAPVQLQRIGDTPIVREEMLSGEDGASLNGPTMMRVPSWVKYPLGKYYLYFAHHAGKYIRLAYTDNLEGPWKIYEGGVQQLADQTALVGHIASPEVVVNEKRHQIYLFYHGGNPAKSPTKDKDAAEGEGGQLTAVSVSDDGLHFKALNVIVGPAYLRVFGYGGHWYALNHSGMLRTTAQLGEPFQPLIRIIGPEIAAAVDPARLGEPGAVPEENRPPNGPFRYSIRHIGTDVAGDRLFIYFSCVGHRPERILGTVVDLKGPPEKWQARGVFEVLRPEREWEGAKYPLAYSNGGISRTKVNELRDPAIFREGGATWLLYTTSGEHGLGLAKLSYTASP